jgi:hypothetical protein
MAMHFLNKRCDECDIIYSVRRPRNPNQVAAVVALIRCPYCHPEALKDVCGACRLPSSVFPIHSNGVCGPCARWQFYLHLTGERRVMVLEIERKRNAIWKGERRRKRAALALQSA